MKKEIHLYHPNGQHHRSVPVRDIPQRRAVKMVRVARRDAYHLGVSTRGTVYSLDGLACRSLRRGHHANVSLVMCLELLGVITPAEMEATLATLEKDRVARDRVMDRYTLTQAANSLGITLNKTQRRKAGLI